MRHCHIQGVSAGRHPALLFESGPPLCPDAAQAADSWSSAMSKYDADAVGRLPAMGTLSWWWFAMCAIGGAALFGVRRCRSTSTRGHFAHTDVGIGAGPERQDTEMHPILGESAHDMHRSLTVAEVGLRESGDALLGFAEE